MTSIPYTVRPGSQFFVPDTRIAKLGALSVSGTAGEVLDVPRADIVSIEVTKVNTGSSHYSITLNNWDNAVAARREGQQQSWPPYKYNNFDHFEFGMRLRIDMRYWPDAAPEVSQTVQAAHGWVPMIAGPITDMKFAFSAKEGARLTIIGEDDLFPLKNRIDEKVTYRRKTEKFIIEDILRRASYPLTLQDPQIELPGFFNNNSNSLFFF